ncbi:MAG: hypothetical protein M1834_006321 [Cirrosporium novae-zelandiae]|nr:MAG: hypothetical protein M1834_006321 [Cirrosporium novae-zelandiae]
MTPHSTLIDLPNELLLKVFDFLPAPSLANLSRTCRRVNTLASDELLWGRLVRENIGSIETPSPFQSFRSLYLLHYPYWFLCRNRIWFSDKQYNGRLVLFTYDSGTGRMNGRTVITTLRRWEVSAQQWDWNPSVHICNFNPKVQLNEAPSIQLPPILVTKDLQIFNPIKANNKQELLLAHAIAPRHPMSVWPPKNIPSKHHVCNQSHDGSRCSGHQPLTLDKVCDTAFRIRTLAGMETFSTISPELYTPTEQKPWQGIWVGDYSGQGCEFLLIIQDDEPLRDISETETTIPGQPLNKKEEPGFKGCMRAIKLTGDSNVPRGELSWVAPDIGSGGLIRVAEEAPFVGARIVKSLGHVALPGFVRGRIRGAEVQGCQDKQPKD